MKNPTEPRGGRANRKLHLAPQDLAPLIPQAALREAAARLQGVGVEYIALPETIALDRKALTLFALIRKTARAGGDKATRKWLVDAAAAHIVEIQAPPETLEFVPLNSLRFSERKMQQIEEYVQSRLADDVRIEEIARHVGMSRAQFIRRFKATTGTTPRQFVIEARVRAAKMLLADGTLGLATIAARTGFASASHFSFAFRRLVKMSPSVYRMQVFSGRGHTPSQSETEDRPPPRLPAAPASAPAAPASTSKLAEFQLEQTSLLINREVRLLQSSKGLGWTDLFAAVTDESPHEGLRGTVPAVWLATANAPNDIVHVSAKGHQQKILPEHAISITGAGDAVYYEQAHPLRARHFYLRQQAIDEVANEMFAGERERRVTQSSIGVNDPILYRLMAAIRAALDDPPAGSRLKIDYLTQALAAHLLTRHSVVGAAPVMPAHAFNARQIGMLSDYVNDNLAADMRLAELGRLVGLGRSQFVERFKATTSMTPHQYVTLRRISHARKLLARPKTDYGWIARTCGFSSPSHFIATFKRITGITPGEYRRMVA